MMRKESLVARNTRGQSDGGSIGGAPFPSPPRSSHRRDVTLHPAESEPPMHKVATRSVRTSLHTLPGTRQPGNSLGQRSQSSCPNARDAL